MYKLEEFKTWLEAKLGRKQNLSHWEDFFRLITNSDGTIKEEAWTGGLPSSPLIENRFQYSFILKKWKEEINNQANQSIKKQPDNFVDELQQEQREGNLKPSEIKKRKKLEEETKRRVARSKEKEDSFPITPPANSPTFASDSERKNEDLEAELTRLTQVLTNFRQQKQELKEQLKATEKELTTEKQTSAILVQQKLENRKEDKALFTQLQNKLLEKEQLINQLQTRSRIDHEEFAKALDKAEEWHQRQKGEIIAEKQQELTNAQVAIKQLTKQLATASTGDKNQAISQLTATIANLETELAKKELEIADFQEQLIILNRKKPNSDPFFTNHWKALLIIASVVITAYFLLK